MKCGILDLKVESYIDPNGEGSIGIVDTHNPNRICDFDLTFDITPGIRELYGKLAVTLEGMTGEEIIFLLETLSNPYSVIVCDSPWLMKENFQEWKRQKIVQQLIDKEIFEFAKVGWVEGIYCSKLDFYVGEQINEEERQKLEEERH